MNNSQPIFILGSGRSGTTLVQRLLNSYDNIFVWGEHAGFLKHIAAAYFHLLDDSGSRPFLFPVGPDAPHSIADHIRQLRDSAHWQAWTNCFEEEDMADFFRRHLEQFFRPPEIGEDCHWGFKEIRYGLDDRVIEFLASLYPHAHFVFVGRHGLDTISSQLKAFHGESRLVARMPTPTLVRRCRMWRRQNECLHAWHVSGRIRSHWLPFEEVAAAEPCLTRFLELLGLDLGPAQRTVLSMEGGRGAAFNSDPLRNRRWKNLGFGRLFVADCLLRSAYERLGYEGPKSLSWFSRPISKLPGIRTRPPNLGASTTAEPTRRTVAPEAVS